MPGNSPLFRKRFSSLKKKCRKKYCSPRVPRKYKNELPEHHSDLFTDENPKGTVHGLKFKNANESRRSISRLKKLYKTKKISFAHMRQIGITMEQRSRYHAHPTTGIKQGNKEWKKFNRSFKK
jgi:hypothetical protein